MKETIYRFRVYSPPKGLFLLLLVMALCFPLLSLMDSYGPSWLQHRELRLLILLIPAAIFYLLFGRFATNWMEAKIDSNGLWLDNYPKWSWGKHDHLFIGWGEIERWIFKKAQLDGHNISWDRLIFKLTDGRKLLILPTDDFDERSDFLSFLSHLETAITTYNENPATQILIQNEYSPQTKIFWAGLRAIFFSAFGLATCFATYLIAQKENPNGWMIIGFVFLILSCCFVVWKNISVIRTSLKK